MRKFVCLLCLAFLPAAIFGCAPGGSVPANYYENDLHHGYPGPAVADPSAT